MTGIKTLVCGAILSLSIINVQAQASLTSTGTLVIVPAEGQVTHANDEATLTLMVEEHDKDKSAAESRVNQKMKQGMDIVRKADPDAKLKSYGYYTYPVYPEDQPRPLAGKNRMSTGWRVGQYLEMRTSNLDGLPKTVAAAQRLLAINGLQFGLSEKTAKKLDESGINAAYKNLTDRIAAIAKAMGRQTSDAVLDTVDFEGSGAYAPQDASAQKMSMRAASVQEFAPVEEPSFEPGETRLNMRIVGKVRFK